MSVPLIIFMKNQTILFWPDGVFYIPRLGLRYIGESREANYINSSASEYIIRTILRLKVK